ncbi:hypothetical protein pb186bvf_003558 [Paramecium bursaria]
MLQIQSCFLKVSQYYHKKYWKYERIKNNKNHNVKIKRKGLARRIIKNGELLRIKNKHAVILIISLNYKKVLNQKKLLISKKLQNLYNGDIYFHDVELLMLSTKTGINWQQFVNKIMFSFSFQQIFHYLMEKFFAIFSHLIHLQISICVFQRKMFSLEMCIFLKIHLQYFVLYFCIIEIYISII